MIRRSRGTSSNTKPVTEDHISTSMQFNQVSLGLGRIPENMVYHQLHTGAPLVRMLLLHQLHCLALDCAGKLWTSEGYKWQIEFIFAKFVNIFFSFRLLAFLLQHMYSTNIIISYGQFLQRTIYDTFRTYSVRKTLEKVYHFVVVNLFYW